MLNQVYANVMDKPILVPKGDVTSLGSAIFAFLAAGTFRSIEEAQDALCPGHRGGAAGCRRSGRVRGVVSAVIASCIFRSGREAVLAGIAALSERREAKSEGRVLEALRAEVLEANLELVRRGLVIYTFGNASGVSREQGLIAIKPSGVPYDRMKPEHMVITDLDGRVVEGDLRPSSDLATHALLYRAFPDHRRGGAYAFAPCHGMGAGGARNSLLRHHARRLFCGAVPVTDPLTAEEIESATS